MRPVVCMVTAPLAAAADEDLLVQRIEAVARAGAHLVQVRQPHLEARALCHLVERLLGAVRGSPARVLVNDRVDVALAAGAHGVHLRGGSLAARRVRGIAPAGFVIGRSVHSVTEAVAAEQDGGSDYLLFGTVFPTGSKPGVTPAGLEVLAATCRAVTLPVLAIGGVTLATLTSVGRAGASGFAAIGVFATTALDAMPEVVRSASSAFDTPTRVP